jgi:hypothetical protein
MHYHTLMKNSRHALAETRPRQAPELTQVRFRDAVPDGREVQMTRDDPSSGNPPHLAPSDWAAAAELAPMTAVWKQLLEDHVPNSDGRCRTCTQGGTGIPTVQWPCSPRKIAEAAARYHARRATP